MPSSLRSHKIRFGHAQYYNNPTYRDHPAFTRNDANIAFNWGVNSPGNGVGSDNFSVRWATDVQLNPGTYRFYALADDNIRIVFNFVSFQPVIDTFASGQGQRACRPAM